MKMASNKKEVETRVLDTTTLMVLNALRISKTNTYSFSVSETLGDLVLEVNGLVLLLMKMKIGMHSKIFVTA
jgi:hypothetical protein